MAESNQNEELGKEAPMPSEQPREETGLLPCPFCGGTPEVVNCSEPDNEGGIVVQCSSCWTSSRVHFPMGKDESLRNVTEAWNTRASPVPLASSPSVTSVETKAEENRKEGDAPCPITRPKQEQGSSAEPKGSTPAASAPAADIGMVIAEKVVPSFLRKDHTWLKFHETAKSILIRDVAQIANEVINSSEKSLGDETRIPQAENHPSRICGTSNI